MLNDFYYYILNKLHSNYINKTNHCLQYQLFHIAYQNMMSITKILLYKRSLL